MRSTRRPGIVHRLDRETSGIITEIATMNRTYRLKAIWWPHR